MNALKRQGIVVRTHDAGKQYLEEITFPPAKLYSTQLQLDLADGDGDLRADRVVVYEKTIEF
jgi:hypothetical protein